MFHCRYTAANSHIHRFPHHIGWYSYLQLQLLPLLYLPDAHVSFALIPSTSLRTTFDLRATIFPKSKEASGTFTAYLKHVLHNHIL